MLANVPKNIKFIEKLKNKTTSNPKKLPIVGTKKTLNRQTNKAPRKIPRLLRIAL